MSLNDVVHDNIDGLLEKTLHGTGDSDAHMMALFGIILQMKPKLVVELGVREGVTTFPMLLGTALCKGHMISVDIQSQHYVPQETLKPYWQFVQADSIKFLEAWDPNVRMDLVFVDDWHEHLHVRRELELLSQYVNGNSIILFHDCMSGQWRQDNPMYMPPDYYSDTGEFAGGGPSTAVRELDPNVWEWSTIPIYHGLTILRKK